MLEPNATQRPSAVSSRPQHYRPNCNYATVILSVIHVRWNTGGPQTIP